MLRDAMKCPSSGCPPSALVNVDGREFPDRRPSPLSVVRPRDGRQPFNIGTAARHALQYLASENQSGYPFFGLETAVNRSTVGRQPGTHYLASENQSGKIYTPNQNRLNSTGRDGRQFISLSHIRANGREGRWLTSHLRGSFALDSASAPVSCPSGVQRKQGQPPFILQHGPPRRTGSSQHSENHQREGEDGSFPAECTPISRDRVAGDSLFKGMEDLYLASEKRLNAYQRRIREARPRTWVYAGTNALRA
ncbi:hypothetical protein B0H11DRAFT_1943899 [Mycena galericulata]|nr:hypothetical protein B0H11DRAFT_1943899 [Mycena galericulata]